MTNVFAVILSLAGVLWTAVRLYHNIRSGGWRLTRPLLGNEVGALIFDLADPQELLGFVREVESEINTNRFVLSQFLPNQPLDGIEFRANIGSLVDQDAAMIRAWDTESPIGGRQGVQRLMGELPPISKKIRLGEEETLRLRALETGNNNPLIQQIYADAANMARSVAARVEMLRGEALYAGTLTINENGVQQSVNFGRSGTHSVAPGTLWSNVAASTPIQDEQAWLSTYVDSNGESPALALTSQAVVNNLLLNAQYRAMAPVNGVTPPFLSLPGINQIRAAYDLPPIVVYETKVRVNGTLTRVIPADRLIYLPAATSGLGRTFTGTTAEAIELAGAQQIANDQVPGMVAVVDKTYDPVATWTKAAAIALPVLMNPDLTLVADVQ